MAPKRGRPTVQIVLLRGGARHVAASGSALEVGSTVAVAVPDRVLAAAAGRANTKLD